MESATLWLAFVAAAAAVASAVFAFVQARAATETLSKADAAQEKAETAQAKAEEAQAKANEIAESARSELARSAAALERANELTEASQPKPAVRWELSPTRGSMWACKNVGDLAATSVQLSGGSGIYCDEDSRADVVPPGQALEFGVMRGAGVTPVLTIEWDDENSSTRNSDSIPMRGF